MQLSVHRDTLGAGMRKLSEDGQLQSVFGIGSLAAWQCPSSNLRLPPLNHAEGNYQWTLKSSPTMQVTGSVFPTPTVWCVRFQPSEEIPKSACNVSPWPAGSQLTVSHGT